MIDDSPTGCRAGIGDGSYKRRHSSPVVAINGYFADRSNVNIENSQVRVRPHSQWLMATSFAGEYGIRQRLRQILAQNAILVDPERLQKPSKEIRSKQEWTLKSGQGLRRRTVVSDRHSGVFDRDQLAIRQYTKRGVVRQNQVGVLSWILVLIHNRKDVAFQA